MGRLILRKLHFVDLVSIGLFFSFLIIFYLYFKRETSWVSARFKVSDSSIYNNMTSEEIALAFSVGDREYDLFGRTTSEITRVETYRLRPDYQVVYLDLRLKALFDPKRSIYSVRGKEILFGETITFSFTKTRFKAIVVEAPGSHNQQGVVRKRTIVEARIKEDNRAFSDVYGVLDYIATAINTNDIVVDSLGNTLVKVLNVDIRPARRTIITPTGMAVVVDDPELKDVFYTLELDSKEINGKLYMFDYLPIVIGQRVPLSTPIVRVWPAITKIVQSQPL